MKYYIIAGESSGDNYGALLINAIKKRDRASIFNYWGGQNMKAAADGQIKSIADTSFMGFYEVIRNLKTIRGLFTEAKQTITTFNPDVLILIDYPGFNLRILKWAKTKGIKTVFYISPQLWAWKKNRYKKLRDYADLFFVILPFEKSFFDELNTSSIYYGHPLTEIIPPQNKSLKPIQKIGLFPGSRQQEIDKHLPLMIEFCKEHKEVSFTIAGMKHCTDHYNSILKTIPSNLSIVYDQSYRIMREVDLAITSSGTATLELALFETPQIVVYKTSAMSYQIGKKLIDLKYISLVNLIANTNIVDELIQSEFNLNQLNQSYHKITSMTARQSMVEGYKNVRSLLKEGNVSENVAKDIINLIAK